MAGLALSIGRLQGNETDLVNCIGRNQILPSCPENFNAYWHCDIIFWHFFSWKIGYKTSWGFKQLWYGFDMIWFNLCRKIFSTKSSNNMLCNLMPVIMLFGSANSRKSRMKVVKCLPPVHSALDFHTVMWTTEASSVQNSSPGRISRCIQDLVPIWQCPDWFLLVRSRSFSVLSTDDVRKLS